MNSAIDLILVLSMLANLGLLGFGGLRPCIRYVTWQGVTLGLLPLLVSPQGLSFRLLLVSVASVTLKGYVFPRLLQRTLRHADVKHEVDPVIGHAASILLGVASLAGAFWIARRFTLPIEAASDLVLPVGLATVMCGLLLIVSRRQALSQVIGYLVLENGIFTLGVPLASHEPLLIEMGILLDVFVAVFVMGIAIFHISREFDHIDVDQLAQLKD